MESNIFDLGFGEPKILVALLLIPATLLFYMRYKRKRRAAAIKFSSLDVLKKAGAGNRKLRIRTRARADLPYALLAIALTLLIIALADPQIPLKELKEGVNVVLVIDDSGSMGASDYKPSRLEAAKRSAAILIESLQEKDNAGVVVFESGATTAAYLTPDKGKVAERLKAIQLKEGRTAIGDGLSLAVDMATSIPNKKRVIILLSDGVANAGVLTPQEAVEYAKLNNIQVHTIGMGSEGQVVLGYDFFGRPQYAELDEDTLKAIAQATGGKYRKSVDDRTLEQIYLEISEDIEREWEKTSIKDWFIAAALIVLLVNVYLIYGRYRIVI